MLTEGAGGRKRMNKKWQRALTGAIVGEFIASQHGLGRTIFYAGSTYEIALVWVAVFVLSVLAVLMYVVVSWLENILRKGTRQ